MIIRRRYLGQVMVNLGFVTGKEINKAVTVQKRYRNQGKDKKIGQILIKQRKITQSQLTKSLRLQKQEMLTYVSPEFVKKAYIFKGLKLSEIEIIASYMKKENFKKGQVVFPQYGKPNKLYFVYSGKMDVLIKIGKITERKSVLELKKGDVFGEMAFIDQSPRSATVKTKTKCTLLSLSVFDYDKIVELLPRVDRVIIRNIAITISKRLRMANESLQILYSQNKKKGILKFLKT